MYWTVLLLANIPVFWGLSQLFYDSIWEVFEGIASLIIFCLAWVPLIEIESDYAGPGIKCLFLFSLQAVIVYFEHLVILEFTV